MTTRNSGKGPIEVNEGESKKKRQHAASFLWPAHFQSLYFLDPSHGKNGSRRIPSCRKPTSELVLAEVMSNESKERKKNIYISRLVIQFYIYFFSLYSLYSIFALIFTFSNRSSFFSNSFSLFLSHVHARTHRYIYLLYDTDSDRHNWSIDRDFASLLLLSSFLLYK